MNGIGRKNNSSWGVQAQANVHNGIEIKTVQKVLEDAVCTLRPAIVSRVRCSSRTDSGVHALMSTAHVDLKHNRPGVVYCPKVVTGVMNEYLARRDIPVRVIKARQIEADLSAVTATSRTYIYRWAVANAMWKWNVPFPPWELANCLLIQKPFDMDKVIEAISAFNGTHNFYAFSNKRGQKREPVRTLSLEINRGRGLLQEHMPYIMDNVEFWELTFKSSGFLYKQVRRITGALYKVGMGKMTKEDIVHLLNNPYDKVQSDRHAYAVPPQGLFLKHVEYNEEDLLIKDDTKDKSGKELQSVVL